MCSKEVPRSSVLWTAVLFLTTSVAVYATPQSMTYQGSLVNAGGQPIQDGPYDIRFEIFGDPSGGVALWSETDAAVQVTGGLFSTILGNGGGTPLVTLFTSGDNSLYLEVAVDLDGSAVFEADEIYSPRVRFMAAAWAMDSDRLQGRDSAFFQRRITGTAPPGQFLTAVNSDGSIVSAGPAAHTHDLDSAYDNGGAGVGRTIVADSGPVEVLGGDGMTVEQRLTLTSETMEMITLDAFLSGGFGVGGGELGISDGTRTTVRLSGNRGAFAGGGVLYMSNASGTQTVQLRATESTSLVGDGGAGFYLSDGTRNTVILDANERRFLGGSSGGARMLLYNSNGRNTILADADTNDDSFLTLSDDAGNDSIRLHSDSVGTAGEISMFDADGDETVEIVAAEDSGTGAQIRLRKADGTSTIEIDADYFGDGRIITNELQITGGSDLSEQFDIRAAKGKVEPGMVVCIDAERPGKLVVSGKTYDRTVAGIISGAGGVESGMMMAQKGSKADGAHPVALTGRVYCRCDAANGPIRPGDLLTTSNTPGHAMKVTDHAKAQGAIIGKAMTALPEGKGLVLVLVALH